MWRWMTSYLSSTEYFVFPHVLARQMSEIFILGLRRLALFEAIVARNWNRQYKFHGKEMVKSE